MSELSVDIVANTQQAQSQVKKLGDTFSDVSDDMKDLVKAGEDVGKSTDDIARDLSKIDGRPFEEVRREVKRADDAIDDMGDEADDARKALDKVSDAGDDIGDKTRKGTDRAKEGLSDFKEESKQTARESAASFDGSAQSIGDAFQEVAANAFSGFGPAGMLAGVAAAAGIGTVIAAIEGANEQTELAKERVAEWADSFIEAGSTILSAGIQAARFQEIITDPEKFSEAEKNAESWGVTIETAIGAMSGNTGAIDEVKTSVGLLGDALSDTKGSEAAIDSFGNVNSKLYEQEQAYNTARDAINKLTGEMDAGAARTKLLSDFNYELINSVQGATVEVDELGNSLYTLPDGTQVMVDAETGQATQNVANFKGDVDGIPDAVTTTVAVRADTSGLSSFYSAIEAARRNGERGITVNTRASGVMQWQ